MEEKREKILIILLVILIILFVSFSVFVIYNKVLTSEQPDNPNDDQIQEPSTDNSDIIDYTDYSQENFVKIIDKELRYLIGKKSLSELSESEKAFMLMYIYTDGSIYTGNQIETSELDNIKDNTSLNTFEVIYEDINNYSQIGININDVTEVLYSLNDGVYTKNQTEQINPTISTYRYDVQLNEDNGIYTITCKYVFASNSLDDTTNINLYYTSDDIIDNNSFYTLESSDNISEEINNYLDNNQETIIDNLLTYTYVFSTENNFISLTDYYVN